MNQAQREAVEREIGNLRDNLARARAQERADPNWVSGNGESIQDVIRNYDIRISDLSEGLGVSRLDVEVSNVLVKALRENGYLLGIGDDGASIKVIVGESQVLVSVTR